MKPYKITSTMAGRALAVEWTDADGVAALLRVLADNLHVLHVGEGYTVELVEVSDGAEG